MQKIITNVRKRFQKLIYILALITFPPPTILARVDQQIAFVLAQGKIAISPIGLALTFQPNDDGSSVEIIKQNHAFLNPKSINARDRGYDIDYDQYKVVVRSVENTINFKLFPKQNSIVNWPNIVEEVKLASYLIPEGEGLFIPARDQYLRKVITDTTFTHHNTMPFIGFMYDHFSVTAVLSTPYRASFKLHNINEGLSFQYDFRARDKHPCYEIAFTFSKADLLEPSKIFKRFLKAQNKYVTLEEKIRVNPKIKALVGAIHIYAWGDGRTIKALKELKDLGFSKIWIGYEEKPNIVDITIKWAYTDYVTPEFISYGKKLGYLVGVYDSYQTMQLPKDADSYNTDFGKEFYSKGGVRNKKGQLVSGFAGRGCSVSMKALEQANNFIVKNRVKKFKADGVNAYFLDCHGMLEAYDDYSSDHPQTIFEDIAIRLNHMNWLSKQGLVVGSEGATAYTIPFLAFSHGNFSTMYALHYRAAREKKNYGGWGPPRRPAIFFKTVVANADYTIRYDPKYRLPMFQAVFHESIIATDRWEIPLAKFSNLYQDRFILEFLYGVPSIWNLDLKAIKHYSNALSQIANEVYPIQSLIAGKPLTCFEYLTTDRMVQKTVYGDNEYEIIGNFKNEPYEDIPAKSLKVMVNNKPIIIKPNPV